MKAKKITIIQLHPCDVWLCKICDLVILKQSLSTGERVFCPECHHKVAEKNHSSLPVILAFTCMGMLLIIPACLLPLIHMQILSSVTDHSIISGIISFARQGMWVPATLISLGIICVPFLYFILTAILLSCMMLNRYYVWLIKVLRLLQHLCSWSMLEIYFLGIVIAMIKLGDIGKVYPGYGLMVFIGLLVCRYLSVLLIKPYVLWKKLELMQSEYNTKKRLSK